VSEYAFLTVDLSITAIVVISALLAYVRGLAREIVTLGALIGASLATYFLFSPAKQLLEEYISSDEIAAGASIAILFIATLTSILLVGRPIARKINQSEAGTIDRFLGFGFGFARGGLIVATIYMVASFVLPGSDLPEVLHEAYLMPIVENAANWLLSFVPTLVDQDVVISNLSPRYGWTGGLK